ncbi:glycosyltransferase [Anaerocolumna aminovalerica]|jgi:GalNAc-alpha-(1->4)-GalNAc-alpha-(1->3)-diNAcBac-PP-undecaprenol alpha-1,4-N-acetyl-D-galactosaminyltransferase|uniref:glycosyltransferase n=1 Tax=Anaerocolumna aminovalerica TaxID=1527 RepID=UPI000BE41311|nr:glycosyltransferase [Anaerocolumna aminovalerica]MBU5333630.1 glycosyltransferase [Anaerocolumna aminovalerica]
MKTKKYLFLINGMVMGGAERVMATIANEFVKRGNEVCIVTLKEPKSVYRLDPRIKIVGAKGCVQSNNKVLRLIQLIYSGIKGFFYYLYYLKTYRPDAVLSFLTYSNLLAIMTRRIFVKNVPVVVSERCDPQKRGYVLKKLCEFMYPMADCLVCQSKQVGSYFKRISRKSNIRIIPNPVNPECIAPTLLNKRRNAIISVGRLSPQKNFDLLIKSFHEIICDYPDYIVEIYGQGPEYNNLNKKIRTLNLENNVFLMGTKKNVMQSVNNARLFVITSNYEGFPNVLIEAMASGLPVISTDFPTGAARELIKDGINGYVVPRNNKKELARAMAQILSNPQLQDSMSEANKKIVRCFDLNKIIDQWNAVLNKEY